MKWVIKKKKEMLTDTVKVMINNLFKENFYEKKN